MTRGWEGKYVTLGSFLRKELGEALRIGPKISEELTLFLRRLTATRPFRWKGCGSSLCSTGGANVNPVTSGSFLRKELPDRAEDRSENNLAKT